MLLQAQKHFLHRATKVQRLPSMYNVLYICSDYKLAQLQKLQRIPLNDQLFQSPCVLETQMELCHENTMKKEDCKTANGVYFFSNCVLKSVLKLYLLTISHRISFIYLLKCKFSMVVYFLLIDVNIYFL